MEKDLIEALKLNVELLQKVQALNDQLSLHVYRESELRKAVHYYETHAAKKIVEKAPYHESVAIDVDALLGD